MRERFARIPWLLILFSIAYGITMLAMSSHPLELYSASPYHRYQANALRHGHLYLADSIESLQPGLAWHDGKVQQVWGLGVGLWLLPFQAVWSLLGGHVFPDRIAFGVAFALLAFYSGSTSIGIIRQRQRAFGFGLIWLVLLCPALWTLARSSQLIFEETVLYALALSLGLLVSIVRVIIFGARSDYWLGCALSALTVWIRPTHGIYGLMAMLLTSSVAWRHHRSIREIAVGKIGWVAGIALLAWTNTIRFGSPQDFGHRLTVSTESMVYLTRFGNPFRDAPPLEAGRELAGALFLNANVRDAGAFSGNLFPGHSSAPRWRRLYLTSFDPSYAILILAAIAGGLIWFFYRRKQIPSPRTPRDDLIIVLLFWSVACSGVLAWFYLYYSALASRYLLDFAPAFTGFALLAFILVSPRWPKLSLLFFGAWLGYEIAAAKVPIGYNHPRRADTRQALSHTRGKPLKEFYGIYTPESPPRDTGIPSNGSGWEPDSGFASDVVILAVDKPQFIELRVEKRRGFNGETAREDVYRAQVDGSWLPLREARGEGDGQRIVFEVPAAIRARATDQVLFLCFSAGYDAEDRRSERILHSVRWR